MKNRSVSTWRHDGELSLFCWWNLNKLWHWEIKTPLLHTALGGCVAHLFVLKKEEITRCFSSLCASAPNNFWSLLCFSFIVPQSSHRHTRLRARYYYFLYIISLVYSSKTIYINIIKNIIRNKILERPYNTDCPTYLRFISYYSLSEQEKAGRVQ